MNKYLMEFIGTFFLVLSIGCTIIPGNPTVIAPLGIAAVLIAMVFAGGHISGAHYNPAVTLGAFIRGRCPVSDVFPYLFAQILGAGTAGMLATLMVGSGVSAPVEKIAEALLGEFLFTFALVFVILSVGTEKGTGPNSYYGLAIGMIVLGGMFAVGGISGGAFNPAVALGLVLMDLIRFEDVWIHISANLTGGVIAALTFGIMNPGEGASGSETA